MTGEALVLIVGSDPVLVAEATDAVLTEVLDGADRSLAVTEPPEDAPVGEIVAAAATPAMLTPRRVVLVRDLSRFSAADLAPLGSWLTDPEPSSVVVAGWSAGRVPKVLAEAVRAGRARRVDANVPRGQRDRRTWVAERAAAAGVRLSPAAVGAILEHLGEDLSRLGAVLDVLVTVHGPGARLDTPEVTPWLGRAGGVAPWDLTDAIAAGDSAAALAALHRLLEGAGWHPLQVLATLHRQTSQLLRLDGSDATRPREAAAVLGTSEFPARKALDDARALGPTGIRRAIEILAEADVDLKGRRAWPEDAAAVVLEIAVDRLARLRAASPAGRRPRR